MYRMMYVLITTNKNKKFLKEIYGVIIDML